MASLWNDVVTGAYTTESTGINGVSADVAAAIESVITDDPCSLSDYVGGCMESMVALQGAVAVAEGRCAVKYMTAADESAKQEVSATMEGVIRNAWETLKEWVEKAYEAIKRFLKKAWNKMKAYFNIARGMIGKYRDVLKSGDRTRGCQVDWAKIDIGAGLQDVHGILNGINGLAHSVNNNSTDYSQWAGEAVKKRICKAIYGNENGPQVTHNNDFNSLKGEILKVIEDGVDNLYQGFFKIGDSTERDVIKQINDGAKVMKNNIDDMQGASDNAKEAGIKIVNIVARAKTNAVRFIAQEGHKAATLKYRLAVKACRKAIKYQHGVREGFTAGVESTSLDQFMAEIM